MARISFTWLMRVWLLFFGLAMFDASLSEGRSKLSVHFPSLPSTAAAPATTAIGTCKSRVEIYGYQCEEHTVTTEDGYILSIQRIPEGREPGGFSGANKPPVLLQHGLLMDGITWLLNSPDESLGYILADNGYDVWIANTRGTIYSFAHVSLSPNDPAYWDWSWDELTAYDLPATLQYVYQQVGQQKMHYVGHSLGTLIAIASFSNQNDILGMLRSAALLSPIAYLGHVSSPLVRGLAESFVAEAYHWLGLLQFDPNGEAVHNLLTTLCKQPGINCDDLMTILTVIRRGTIAKYDYDSYDANMKQYGQKTPPAYNVSAIPNDFPLFLSYGGRDYLSDVEDVEHLLDTLKFHDADKLTTQYVDNYAHADFVMAVNAMQIVYYPLMAFFKVQGDR